MSQIVTRRLIALAAGGSGGHMFPAAALAEALARRGYALTLITDRRGQAFTVAGGEVEIHRIRASGLGDRSLTRKLLGVIELGFGLIEARQLLKRLRPAAIAGFGGYASVPTLLAASQLGIPTVLHEQNAVLGRANRLLASHATRLATSFEAVSQIKQADRGRVVMTGNPVRDAVARVSQAPYPAPAADGTLSLLITGGSQGARVFGRIVPQAVALLPESVRRRLSIVQQCRPEDIEAARDIYLGLGVEAELSPFFADLPERLARAQLVICRSGGSTVAELTAAGRPSILVPYPYHSDNQQGANAQALENAGAAWLMPEAAFTAQALAARLEPLLVVPARLVEMAEKARALGRLDAAERLAGLVLEIAPANGGHGGIREVAA
ncbi:MAG: undecaprenyldiphospho-muramoylpentapeptide beta-N-acetylglucosaminyltransferase [Proteobacteria bacterium]|nr:undecaprenyldiphospho-muramoylpentapeptide beta-N-acetylglucosaminyltransferase [Pseudomonadota bacterium]MBI3496580.1 undecaprenyldiphospho-muramoylpentapeptide beta-N-acetylglucosaminyltransferase [Pseudomonadota bacterium]